MKEKDKFEKFLMKIKPTMGSILMVCCGLVLLMIFQDEKKIGFLLLFAIFQIMILFYTIFYSNRLRVFLISKIENLEKKEQEK